MILATSNGCFVKKSLYPQGLMADSALASDDGVAQPRSFLSDQYSIAGGTMRSARLPIRSQRPVVASARLVFHVWHTIDTGQTFIDRSAAGYTVAELDAALHVQTQQALLHLQRKARVHREKMDGVFVYVSMAQPGRSRQLTARRQMAFGQNAPVTAGVLAHELKAAIVLFFGLLDERQRRFYAGLESLKVGAGGDDQVAQLLGVDPHTVARGRLALLDWDIDVERVRKAGGGRPPAENTARHDPR